MVDGPGAGQDDPERDLGGDPEVETGTRAVCSAPVILFCRDWHRSDESSEAPWCSREKGVSKRRATVCRNPVAEGSAKLSFALNHSPSVHAPLNRST